MRYRVMYGDPILYIGMGNVYRKYFDFVTPVGAYIFGMIMNRIYGYVDVYKIDI